MPEKDIPDWEQEEFNSRTEIKKAAEAVTDMGDQLSEMTVSAIKKMPMPEDIRQAVLTLKEMKEKKVGPALKRQKLFLGRLLRGNEAAIHDIKMQIQQQEQKAKLQNAHFHRLEKWRDRLLAGGDEALSDLMNEYPQADRTQLRQLIRNAHKEAEQNKPPKSSRLIFQYLRGLAW